VTGHIDDSDVEPLLVRPDEIQLCEPEIDRDLSLLFLREPIGVRSCERFYQRAFAVIDMPGRRQDEMFLHDLAAALEMQRHPERSEGPHTG
jgi:hypothetical protein